MHRITYNSGKDTQKECQFPDWLNKYGSTVQTYRPRKRLLEDLEGGTGSILPIPCCEEEEDICIAMKNVFI